MPPAKANARVAGPSREAAAAASPAVEAAQAAAAEDAVEGDATAAGSGNNGAADDIQPARQRRLLGAAKGVRYAFANVPGGCNLYSSVQLPAVPFLVGGAWPAAP